MRTVALEETFWFTFPSRAFATGIPEALGGTPDLSCIELDSSLGVIDTGVTVAAHGTITALNVGTIAATAANGFEAGKTYDVVIDTGTVDSVSAVGEKVYEFRIESASELAARLLRDTMYPAATLGASASHSTTVIDMTGAIDAQTPASGIVGEVLGVYDATDGHVELVRCTAFTVTTLLATVARIDDAGALGFTPASGDYVFRLGVDPKYAVEQALTDIKLDHLIAVAESDDPADDSIVAKIAASSGDWSDFVGSTDALQAVRDTLVLGRISGTAQTGTLSTTTMTTDLTGYANDELIGRVVIFTGGTADGQAAAITDYASASGQVTYSGGITTAPANNDTFIIV